MNNPSKLDDESSSEQENAAASDRDSTKDEGSDEQDASAPGLPDHHATKYASSIAQTAPAPALPAHAAKSGEGSNAGRALPPDLSGRHAKDDGRQLSQPPPLPPSHPSIFIPKGLTSLGSTDKDGSSSSPPPPGSNNFVPEVAKELIRSILREKFTGVTYNQDKASLWARDITESIKAELKNMQLDRYKIVVQAAVGQHREQGLQMSCRCFWDPNTDNYAHESFANESIFCIAGAFAMFMY